MLSHPCKSSQYSYRKVRRSFRSLEIEVAGRLPRQRAHVAYTWRAKICFDNLRLLSLGSLLREDSIDKGQTLMDHWKPRVECELGHDFRKLCLCYP